MTHYSRSNPVLPTTSQNANAVNPSVILPFATLCNFEVPTTELDPDFVPCVWACAGEFATFDEAKAACYALEDHPALIAMQVSQQFKEVSPPQVKMASYTSRFFESDLPQDLHIVGGVQ